MKLERIRYRSGQRLDARDLQQDFRYQAQMRELHVVALHNTWGIALGLDVQLIKNRVQVSPGFAYDCYGREILLSSELDIPLPNYEAVLAIRHLETVTTTRSHTSTCFQVDDVPVGLAWRWSESDAVCPGVEIPLVLVAADGSIDFSVRRVMRNFSPIQIYGEQVKKDSLEAKGNLLQWSVTVDTSKARFNRLPSYSVQALDLTREALLQGLLDEAELPELLSYFSGPFLAITAANDSSFTLEARWGIQVEDDFDTLFQSLLEVLDNYPVHQLPITLTWFGVA